MLVTVLLSISYIRQSDMKEKYGITYEISDMSEPMIYDGYQITVEEASLWNVDDYFNYLGPDYMSYAEQFEYYQDGELIDSSVLEVRINVLKLEESSKEHGVYDLALKMENAYTAYDPFLTAELSKCDTKFNLKTGESQEYIVPFSVIENHFSKEQWENRDKIEYMLVSSVYPVERAINITNITNRMNDYVPVEYDAALTEDYNIPDYSEALFDSEVRELLDGGNEVHAYGTETMEAGYFEVTLKKLDYIYNIDEVYQLMSEDGYSNMLGNHIDDFDSVTGEVLPEKNLGFMTATVEVKNIDEENRTFNIIQAGRLSTDCVNSCSEVIYTSKYNINGDDHTMLMLVVEPDETITITTIMMVCGYDCYERDVWYYGVDFRGGQKTKFFIEWDMTKDGGGM